ncbi:MAG: hypothetical protein U1F42_10110 [Candidatus Competibacteraceae bacterium]
MPPHNLNFTVMGASMLWVGWFGFNAGSAVAANGSAGMAMAVTQIATATAALAGCSPNGCHTASPACWVSPPARWLDWWRSRRRQVRRGQSVRC